MRIPYVPDPPTNLTPSEEEIVQRVRTRRGPRGLIPLDRALLHSPPIADGWNSMLGAIRTKTNLPADLREIAICRVALLNKAWFEWDAHCPILLASAPAFNPQALHVMKTPHPEGKGEFLTDKQWVVLRYADAMTRDVEVEDGIFEQLKSVAGFGDREVVELTGTVAAYNMVSRFLVALDVGERNGKGI